MAYNFLGAATYEAAAMFMALLAYPSDRDDEHRLDRTSTAVAHLFLRSNPEGNGAWLNEVGAKHKHIFPDFDVDRELKGFMKRLNDHMHAARMGISFLQELELGRTPKLPKVMKRFSLNEWANVDIAPDQLAGSKETGNLETRIWRPTLPALHMAIAVQKILALADSHGQTLTFLHFFLDGSLLKIAVNESEIIAGDLKKVTRFKWPYEKRTQVVMG